MQFRIAELLVVVAVAAFGLTCLVEPTSLAETLFVNFTYAIIFIAIVFSIGRNDGRRAFWLGFLSASLLYTVFSLIPDSYGYSPRMSGSEITTKSLSLAYAMLQAEDVPDEEVEPEQGPPSDSEEDPFAGGGMFCIQESGSVTAQDFEPLIDLIRDTIDPDAWVETGGEGTILPFATNITCIIAGPAGDELSFMAIGHSLWALLLGLIGGHASQFVYESSRKNLRN